jgi:EVE domain
LHSLRKLGVVVQTWIFQGNPDQFDLNAFLGTALTQLPWLVTRYARQIAVGDRVFLWRTQGSAKAVPGVIAEATVVAPTMPRLESADAIAFWRNNAKGATEVRPRALLRLNRVAGTKEVLRREWLAHDPILSDLPNLKMAAGTNYPVTTQQAARLYALEPHWPGLVARRERCRALGILEDVRHARVSLARLARRSRLPADREADHGCLQQGHELPVYRPERYQGRSLRVGSNRRAGME